MTMSESEAGPVSTDAGSWVARLTHHADDERVSYTILGRRFDTRQEAELTVQCWWATGYGRRGVVAIHVRPAELGRELREEDWIPVSAGAKEACYLLGAFRPQVEPRGTLRLVPNRASGT